MPLDLQNTTEKGKITALSIQDLPVTVVRVNLAVAGVRRAGASRGWDFWSWARLCRAPRTAHTNLRVLVCLRGEPSCLECSNQAHAKNVYPVSIISSRNPKGIVKCGFPADLYQKCSLSCPPALGPIWVSGPRLNFHIRQFALSILNFATAPSPSLLLFDFTFNSRSIPNFRSTLISRSTSLRRAPSYPSIQLPPICSTVHLQQTSSIPKPPQLLPAKSPAHPSHHVCHRGEAF